MSTMTTERFQSLLKSFSDVKPILVVGDVGVDKYTSGTVERISPEAPVPVLRVNQGWLKLGLAANVSDNFEGLGVPHLLCSIIGDDAHANEFENLLEENNLKTWGLVRSKERMTTVKERITTAAQQICRVDYETVQDLTTSEEEKLVTRVEELAKESGSLIIQDYGKGSVTESLAQKLIDIFKKMKKPIYVDPSRIPHPLKYKGCTLLKPNRTEVTAMAKSLGYHGGSLTEMAELLMEKLELEKILVTLGAEGMGMMEKGNNNWEVIPTVAPEVFDVSGAGDTVIASVSAAIDAGATLKEAAWVGNCAAGVVVGKRGTAKVSLSELKSFHEKLLQKL